MSEPDTYVVTMVAVLCRLVQGPQFTRLRFKVQV